VTKKKKLKSGGGGGVFTRNHAWLPSRRSIYIFALD
jgi:hypothetical protein